MEILPDFSLKKYNTFGIEAKATSFVAVKSIDELKEVLKANSNIFILGGGSNMLLTQDIDKLVVHINLKGIEVVNEDEVVPRDPPVGDIRPGLLQRDQRHAVEEGLLGVADHQLERVDVLLFDHGLFVYLLLHHGQRVERPEVRGVNVHGDLVKSSREKLVKQPVLYREFLRQFAS